MSTERYLGLHKLLIKVFKMTSVYLTPQMMQSNPRLELADQYVRFTNRHVFLTGKAGTGKTTFLKNLKNTTPKRMVIVAPTGVAAINAGGVTIHSFFQLPFSPFIPHQDPTITKSFERKFTADKIRAIRAIDLLIIDEISMVRADLLDAIDEVLRKYRNRLKPFGGVQLLMIGDLHQLAPVIKDEEWDMIKTYYPSIYFFESHALKQSQFLTIELNKIYRQEDEVFINLLNKIRNRNLDTASIQLLNTRYQPDFKPEHGAEYITLTTHNHSAQSINQNKLMNLSGRSYSYAAEVEGNFPEHMYPNEYKLDLKVGAQVMFVKNDSSRDKLFYNGKLGVITKIDDDKIYVRCQGDQVEIIVLQVTWNNIKYALDDKKVMKEQVIGTFTQYPIKTAWAITIHKSQGLTFERAVIDAQSSFAHGQVYVALSRCKTFEGLILSTPIHVGSVKSDSVISTFNQEAELQEPTEQSLLDARKESQCEWIRELFDFKTIQKNLSYLNKDIDSLKDQLSAKTLPAFTEILHHYESKLGSVADKFSNQLEAYFQQPELPEANEGLQERIKKGSIYLLEKLNQSLFLPLKALDLDTDNKENNKLLIKSREYALKNIFEKIQAFSISRDGFNATTYLQAKANAAIDYDAESTNKKATRPKVKAITAADIEIGNNDVFALLKNWRDQVAEQKGVERYAVLPQKSLKHLSQELPTDRAALSRIIGIGKKKLDQYGEAILEMIKRYCEKNNIQSKSEDPKADTLNKVIKGQSQLITFELFKQGKSMADIAIERQMAPSTIESHISTYIGLGLLPVEDVLDREKINKMKNYMMAHPSLRHKELKDTFGDEYSYGEIKMIWASMSKDGLS